jgi:hypothetical protein
MARSATAIACSPISDEGIDRLKRYLDDERHGLTTVECYLLAGLIRRLEIVEDELRTRVDPTAHAERIAEAILGPALTERPKCSVEGCQLAVVRLGVCRQHAYELEAVT